MLDVVGVALRMYRVVECGRGRWFNGSAILRIFSLLAPCRWRFPDGFMMVPFFFSTARVRGLCLGGSVMMPILFLMARWRGTDGSAVLTFFLVMTRCRFCCVDGSVVMQIVFKVGHARCLLLDGSMVLTFFVLDGSLVLC